MSLDTYSIVYKHDRIYSSNKDITKEYLENVLIKDCSLYYSPYITQNKQKEKCCVCGKIPRYVKLTPKCRCVYHIKCYDSIQVHCKNCGDFV